MTSPKYRRIRVGVLGSQYASIQLAIFYLTRVTVQCTIVFATIIVKIPFVVVFGNPLSLFLAFQPISTPSQMSAIIPFVKKVVPSNISATSSTMSSTFFSYQECRHGGSHNFFLIT